MSWTVMAHTSGLPGAQGMTVTPSTLFRPIGFSVAGILAFFVASTADYSAVM